MHTRNEGLPWALKHIFLDYLFSKRANVAVTKTIDGFERVFCSDKQDDSSTTRCHFYPK